MKKIFLYTALGAAMVASCSQDECLETIASRGSELSFRTTVGTASRANVANLDMLKTKGFKVTAFLYGMDGETKKVLTRVPYFNDMAVTWNAGVWSHTQCYWPGSNEYVETGVAAKGFDFVAYSPSATTGVSYDGNKMKVTDYTIPAAVDDEKDLVVANAQNQTEAANGTNGVGLDFKHVLSQVVVKATNASSFYHIEVEKVELHNVHGKGTLTYDYAATSPVAWAITDATVSSNTYTSAPSSATTLSTTASAIHNYETYYMMLPQTSGVWNPETEIQAAAGAYFVVSCKIYSAEEANNTEYLFGIGSASTYGRVAIPVPANGTGANEGKLVWENGKKYTYTLNFFKDGGGAGYLEPGSTVPAKSVVPSTIKFSASVSVEAWGEGSLEPETPAGDPNLLSGNFSVSATKKVSFTKGNLYWDGSAFKFEAKQTDYQTSWDANHVSHFYWSKTASVAYAQGYSDGSASTSDKFFCGEDNKITVEGTEDLYALSSAEWNYLLTTRENASSLYKYGVTVADKSNCLIIAPDGYTGSIESSYNSDAWATAEAAGLVCLPAAGFRGGSNLSSGGSSGCCWSSSPSAGNASLAYSLFFYSDYVDPADYSGRDYGFSLRLVK